MAGQIRVVGKIVQMDERGCLASFDCNPETALLRKFSDVVLLLPDGRSISPMQRRKAYVLIREISNWSGYPPEDMKDVMKWYFLENYPELLDEEYFSLSNCDMTTAKEFITFLINFIVEHGIPTKEPLFSLCEDIGKYVYACLMHKKCVICGKGAELHHYDAIGMGRNRNAICHIGMRVISLCRGCHTKAHTKGVTWLEDDLKLYAIPLTVEIGKKYGMNKKQLGAPA